MAQLIWLRAESKPNERRSPISPEGCRRLIDLGIDVVIERSPVRIFSDEAYESAGCRLVSPGAWHVAPQHAVILGLKELPESSMPLSHAHCYFAHAFKHQPAAERLLRRFVDGGGQLYDLEYFVDNRGSRVAAFGYWAGYVGAALGVQAWCASVGGSILQRITPEFERAELVQETKRMIARTNGSKPTVLVTGSLGRCGRGASDFLRELELDVVGWDLHETTAGGPFRDILNFDILVHCALARSPTEPFLTRPMLHDPARLRTIVDVTCDIGGPLNLLPIAENLTSFDEPVHRLGPSSAPIDFIAIDHLPTLLPLESSLDFSKQLLPSLESLAQSSDVWRRAGDVFLQKSQAYQ